jgi:hypothetical protein
MNRQRPLWNKLTNGIETAMGNQGTNVTKTTPQAGIGNTVVLQEVKIYFQVYPGVAGTDDLRGIAGVKYWVWIDQKGYGYSGTTAADGGIELTMPLGSSVKITIFDTEFEIIAVLSPIPLVPDFTPAPELYKGIQRRLQLLGYYYGNVDGASQQSTREALLHFQADSSLNADHVSSNSTVHQLSKDSGV